MKKGKGRKPPTGELRMSQVLTTFGPGAMVDLPEHSVIVGGLEHWHGDMREIHEARLERRVSAILGVPETIGLRTPPVDLKDPTSPRTGITVMPFPEWFVAQMDRKVRFGPRTYRARPLIHRKAVPKGIYVNEDREKFPVVPVRFVQACVNGHISDIDWIGFVHEDFRTTCRGALWLDEGGTGGDLADIYVRCGECGKRRPLSVVKVPGAQVLGRCRGLRPWLGGWAREECVDEATGKPVYSRLLARHASNAYFSQVLSVISIPEPGAKVQAAVDEVYDTFLLKVETVVELAALRELVPMVSGALDGYTDEQVLADLKRRRKAPGQAQNTPIKQAEVETLLAVEEGQGEDAADEEFFAQVRAGDKTPMVLAGHIERVVLVHRLREVMALVGFTRFEPVMPDIEGDLALDVRRAALAQNPSWVPAVENRGEGVFLSIQPRAIEMWLQRDAVQYRGKQLEHAFQLWAKSRGIEDAVFPGLPYVMLHTLSHLLLTTVALECGYAASSIRERVYACDAGYGILLYTGSPGAEGTLGGLVEVGRRIERYLINALSMGRLCSNDPVCAQHRPDDPHEERFLHGAACHGCLLIAETSCERRNEFLDRALVVSTVEGLGAEFFEDGML